MILKKKINKFPFLKEIKKFISLLIGILGSISLLALLVFFIYYFNSGMYERYKPFNLIKKIDKIIISKYLGFSVYETNDYLVNNLRLIKYYIFNNELENIQISIDQENLYNLELQRKNKLEGSGYDYEKYSKAELNYKKDKFKIKLRVKGDRVLHWYKKDQTSYKIDLRGEDRIWGMEEFSVQKPITRNYIYEYIFHKFLKFNDLISLKYFFVNLSTNDTKNGIYAVEEGFSKELIERNKKRNGPIFGLNELIGFEYPNIEYDLYSSEYWNNNNIDLINNAKLKLLKVQLNEIEIQDAFDLKKWATFFAVIDLTSSFHGSIPKSVKLFFNPVTSKFEPIGFDGHYNSGLFQNFLTYDFTDVKNKNCDYLCPEKEWFLRFFKTTDQKDNDLFVDLYLDELKRISSKSFIDKFLYENIDKINFYNKQFLSERSQKDKVLYKGLGLYSFDEDYLINRSKYIQRRILDIEKKRNFKKLSNLKPDNKKNILETKEIQKVNSKYFLNQNFNFKEDFYLDKNSTLYINAGIKITFEKDVSFFSEGSIHFDGTKKNPIIIEGKNKEGSLIFANNFYKLNNVIIKNLSYPKVKNRILYGGINFLNSDVRIYNTSISSSNSEDAINIVSSNSLIRNLKVKNISADAIDIDFGKLNFINITCEIIANDCLDVSGATVNGDTLNGKLVKDKGLSFGENANGKISNITIEKSKLGIAVKDGSHLKLSNYNFINNEYDAAVFNKKKEYEGSVLEIDKIEHNEKLNFLIGKKNNMIINDINLTKKMKNKKINQIFY